MNKTKVLVAGAGPSGLTAALFLSRAGMSVHVLERETKIYDDPRAATFHPPTLEMFAECGVTDDLHRLGIVAPIWQMRDRKLGCVAEFDLGLLSDVTPFPYRLQCEQHKLVAMLRQKLEAVDNVTIEYGCEVLSATQDPAGVSVETSAGQRHGDYLLGADGGRSAVRKSQAIDFAGFTYPERFLVITTPHDFAPDGFAYSNYISDPQEWAASFKVPGPDSSGRWRVVFPTDPDASESQLLSFAKAEQRVRRLIPRENPYDIVHTNLYAVHQRVADNFRKGRVFLAGDAAHVNNPLGGMGMNFGIHDAVNFADKMAGARDEDSLDRYDRQRRHVANEFLQTMTIQNKRALEEKDPAKRSEWLETMRATSADPDRARAFMMRSSMIEGVRAANAIQ